MASCERYLSSLVSRVEPTEHQKEGARRSHNHLRTQLDSGQMAKWIVDSYLSGSYARDTAIAPLDDVDVVFLIDPTHWRTGLQSFFESLPTPSRVLETFANAIRYRYQDSSIHLQRRSVRLDLSHISIDAVPAVRGKGDSILIGDCPSEEWISSAPKTHEAIAAKVNQSRGGLFKPLVKILKFWNSRLPSTARLKSFAVETMATRVFHSENFTSLEMGFLYFLDFLLHAGGGGAHYKWDSSYGVSLTWLSTEIPDTAGTGSNLAAKVDGDRRKRFLENARVSRDRMLEAKNAAYDSTADAKAREAIRE